MRLKALLFGFVLAALAFGQASAQKFDLGVEAGANFANFIGSDVNTTLSSAPASKLGFVGGAFICLNFGNVIGIRPELLYEQKGAAISGTSTSDELDYIEVPILLKFSLGLPGINPALLVGPAFSWNTVAKDVNNNTIPGINSSDVGIIGGIEVDIDKFLVSGRYELGLQNIRNNVNVQNGTITLLVGYSFI
jgi:hypothetical protein